MMNDVEMIKYQLQQFENLKSSKQLLNKELSDVVGLLAKANETITNLSSQNLSQEQSEILMQSEKDKIELVNRINEIAEKIKDVNSELQQYDTTKIDSAKNYIAVMVEFSKLSDDIKLIEKMSKKSSDSKVEVISAEGRKKKIDADYVDEYNTLVNRKKELMSKQSEAYHKISNIPSLMEQKKVIEQIENPTPVLQENKVTEEIDIFDNLPLEEKITETKNRIERIIKTSELPNQGKKRLITYNGNKYDIPQIYYGRFSETMQLLRRLEKEQMEKQNPIEKTVIEQSENIAAPIEQNINDGQEKNVEEVKKEEQIESVIVKKRKVIDIKERLKKHWKPVLAAALALTISTSALLATLVKNAKDKINLDNPYTIEEVAQDYVLDNQTINFQQNDVTGVVPVVEKIELSYPETANVVLGESVSLKNGAPIYNNMYDATNQNNKLNPLYPDSSMKINGAVFNVNGNLIYVNDQHKIDEFQQLGCQITALSLSIDGVNTTGFYNVNDVNINTIEEVRTL